MSSFITLQLPKENRSDAWDSTIDDTAQWQVSPLGASITVHAIAHQSCVCGMHNTQDLGLDEEPVIEHSLAASDWMKWSTSFAPHRVASVVSNQNGSCIAVSTDAGTVSLLRGSDGTVLATRQVVDASLHQAPIISLVSSQTSGPSLDTLVVQPPAEHDGPILLVSNIDGDKLNDNNPLVISQATRSMGMHMIRMPENAPFSTEDIRKLCGYYLNSDASTIRFSVVDGEGHLSLVDYDLTEKSIQLVQHKASFGDGDWTIDFEADIQVQFWGPSQQPYLIFSAFYQKKTKVCWFDLKHLSPSCEYFIAQEGTKRPVAVAIEAVENCHDASIAVAIATKKARTCDQVKIEVIQIQVEETMGLVILSDPRPVYAAPLEGKVQSISLAGIGKQGRPFAFRTKINNGAEDSTCLLFWPEKQATVGKIRLLVQRNKFQEAKQVLLGADVNMLVEDSNSTFHPSEIAVKQLQHVLSRGSVSGEVAVRESRSCLQQLAAGASSPNPTGQELFLKAGYVILEWPGPQSQNSPSVSEVLLALKGFLAAMSSVQYRIESTGLSELKQRLLDKSSAIEYLSTTIDSAQSMKLDGEFSQVQSPQDLFTLLVRLAYFDAAELMWRSQLKQSITASTTVEAITQIDTSVDPRDYASLLFEVVVPDLSINHGLLPKIVDWCCTKAEEFDDNDHDGDDNTNSLVESIFLLEGLEQATKSLCLRMHSSFASYAPFSAKYASTTRVDLSASSSSLKTSFDSHKSTSGVSKHDGASASDKVQQEGEAGKLPMPTMLELNRLNGGAKKSVPGSITRLRLEDIVACENVLETKLRHAILLREARELGLSIDKISLRTFLQKGGIEALATELVRHYSASSTTHEARQNAISVKVRDFCESSGAKFNDALLEYAYSLCGSKKASRRAIDETASIALCCSTAKAKCQVTLVALRAALFCHYSSSWLSKLSEEAMQWSSGDADLQSELQEASRLLLIDGILGKYCGEGSREVFHVENPRHAYRLLEFISKHIHQDSMLTDALDLCEAFHHLSRETACTLMLQAFVEANELGKCEDLLKTIKQKDPTLAFNIFSRVLDYCMDAVAEFSQHENMDRDRFRAFASAAHRILPIGIGIYNSNFIGAVTVSSWRATVLENFLNVFEALLTLQGDHQVFIPAADLYNVDGILRGAIQAIENVLDSTKELDHALAGNAIGRAKRICSLFARLCGVSGVALWHIAAGMITYKTAMKGNDRACIQSLRDLSLLSCIDNDFAARACLSVAFSLFMKASETAADISTRRAMTEMILGTALVQDRVLAACPKALLKSATELGELADVLSHVLIRSDEGVGEMLDAYRNQSLNELSRKDRASTSDRKTALSTEKLRIRKLNLHQSWYVGDGLLLPPRDALAMGIDYCIFALSKNSRRNNTNPERFLRLYNFLAEKGALFLGLRLICNASSLTTAQRYSIHVESMYDTSNEVVMSLAERCLGGSNSGMTSGSVDSELALAFLLCLPTKTALKLYGSSLPAAISTRDFGRVLTIASIGKVAGKPCSILSTNSNKEFGWKKQQRFVRQCKIICNSAFWWQILHKVQVPFDPLQFDVMSLQKVPNAKKNAKGEFGQSASGAYASSLVLTFLENMSSVTTSTDLMLKVGSDFLLAFGAAPEIGIEKYVEFLLSSPVTIKRDAISGTTSHFRPAGTALLVQQLIKKLGAAKDRMLLIRRCLIILESCEHNTQYEHMSIVLDLYHLELGNYISQDVRRNKINPRPFLAEMDLIDRRRDALAILVSFFQGGRDKLRPSFSQFFLPLRDSFEDDSQQNMDIGCDALGKAEGCREGHFDPLDAFNSILQSELNLPASSALAPICLALGVPRGFVHSRALVARFQMAKLVGAPLPLFDGDVVPTLSKLQVAFDKARLAEWCSQQYDLDSPDKMACLDIALSFSIQASNEAEEACHNSSNQTSTSRHVDDVSAALERVKRVSNIKDILSDRISINTILRASDTVGYTDDLSAITNRLVLRLDEKIWKLNQFVPEEFVDVFLSEASLLAAEASLDVEKPLSIGRFHRFSAIIQNACRSISEKYSHVQADTYCQKLAQSWLFGNDEVVNIGTTTTNSGQDENLYLERVVEVSEEPLNDDVDEEDTINFVMDLSALRRNHGKVARAETGASKPKKYQKQLTTQEEPSSLKINGCAREESEYTSRRDALRIAFVLTFTTKSSAVLVQPDPMCDHDENEKPLSENVQSGSEQQLKTRTNLLSRLNSRGSSVQTDAAMHHSRYLLQVVFASSGSNEPIQRGRHTSFESILSNSTSRNQEQRHRTVTFAMRHRALRAASILCPQEALEEVAKHECYLKEGRGEIQSLKICTYGAFVAKEIEEMGLPLPHSNLAQLSTMHFPSYARTLWRHHRSDESCKSKGRLLLLILEMYAKEKIADFTFMQSILEEIMRLQLPRTMLLALDCIARSCKRQEGYSSHSGEDGVQDIIHDLAVQLMKKILADFKGEIDREEYANTSDAFCTMEQFCNAIELLLRSSPECNLFCKIVDLLLGELDSRLSDGALDHIAKLISRLVKQMKADSRTSYYEKLLNGPHSTVFTKWLSTRKRSRDAIENDGPSGCTDSLSRSMRFRELSSRLAQSHAVQEVVQ